MQPPLRLVRAGNASPMTFTGTNSYLVGRGEVTLIDPGPDDPAHLAAILRSLDPGERIAAILVTHAHLDHTALVPAVARATGAPVLAFGDALAGRTLSGVGLGGGEGVDVGFRPDRTLADGERISVGDEDLVALHTPGHFGNHLSFLWRGKVFSGDLAMGWASTLISPPDGDLSAFLTSAARLRDLDATSLLPGHGEAVADPAARLDWLIAHRQARSDAIVSALGRGPATIPALTRAVYTDTPAHLLPAAERNVLAHLLDLWAKSQVFAEPAPEPDAVWRLA
jgi:glyoxylase-like metal-dependent hydrolase (beta-lactamase superfamily II)